MYFMEFPYNMFSQQSHVSLILLCTGKYMDLELGRLGFIFIPTLH